ncbi:MFS transporter [Dermacoccaceae bacterium W4C1]
MSVRRSPVTLPVILLAQFVIPMSIAGTAVAMPDISDDLGTSPTLLQWVVNGFNVAFALSTLIWGALADRVGHRLAFRAGVAIAALGSLGSALAPNLWVLDAARVLTGIGAAAVLTGATALISGSYAGAARTRAFAIFGTVNGLGLAVGPGLSGVVVAGLGWRGVFVAQAAVLVLAWLGSVALPVVSSGAPGGPALDLSLLRNPSFAGMLLVPVAGAFGFVTFLTYLPNALSGVHGMGPAGAGAFMLIATVPVLVAPVVVGALVTRVGLRSRPVILTSLIALLIGDLLMVLVRPDVPVVALIGPMLLIGLGFGLPIGLVDGEALAAVAPERAGTAAGLLNFARIGSEAIAVAGYSATLAAVLATRIADPTRARLAAAGHHVAPQAYADSLRIVAFGLAVVIAALLAGVLLLQRQENVTLAPAESREIPGVQDSLR